MNEKQKLFTRHSIGTRIAALFMLLILVITGVMTYVSISVSTSELLDSSTDYTEQLILRVNAELDMYVEYMKDISDFIVDPLAGSLFYCLCSSWVSSRSAIIRLRGT